MTIVDATKELLCNVLKYKPFLIKPNKQELEEIFNTKIKTEDEVVFYGNKLKNMGAKNVLISLGAKGAVLICENGEVYKEKAVFGTLVNSVGAGDSMVAGFLAGYLENKNFSHAFKMALATGCASAFSENLATKDDVDAIYKKY